MDDRLLAQKEAPKGAHPRKVRPSALCLECGATFTPYRDHQRFCDTKGKGRCRNAFHNRRVKRLLSDSPHTHGLDAKAPPFRLLVKLAAIAEQSGDNDAEVLNWLKQMPALQEPATQSQGLSDDAF